MATDPHFKRLRQIESEIGLSHILWRLADLCLNKATEVKGIDYESKRRRTMLTQTGELLYDICPRVEDPTQDL